jgi:DNA invertase Pin-like site-specific DNA recombinase
MPTVYGYARASTQKGLDLQIGVLRAAGCERVFSDLRASAELGDGWAELMQVAEVGDTIRVAEPSRLTRSPMQAAILLRSLGQRGIAVEELPRDV